MSIDMLNERSTFLGKAFFLVFTLNLSAMLQQSQTGTVLRVTGIVGAPLTAYISQTSPDTE